MDFVFGKRKFFYIFLRRLVHLAIRILQEVSKRIISLNDSKTLLVYPEFKDKEELADTLNRLAWAIPENSNVKIHYLFNEDIDLEALGTPEYQRNFLKKSKHFKRIESKEISYNDYRLILLHKALRFFSLKFIFRAAAVKIIDKLFYSMLEADMIKEIHFHTLTQNEIERYRTESKDKFQKMSKLFKDKKSSTCFVTGPSFSKYSEFSFSNENLKIICNSTIINKDFLKYINGPDILVFSDPVFHFSSCEYSCKYRDLIEETLKDYPETYIIIPDVTVPLMNLHFPHLEEKIIGVSFGDEINWPNFENLTAMRTGNILTLLMLPLAASLTDKIYIIGADGRNKEEKYFWKHNKSAQLNDEMESAYMTHPSFFRDRSYSGYYEVHCQIMQDMVSKIEDDNKVLFSLTRSYIDPLVQRYKEINKNESI